MINNNFSASDSDNIFSVNNREPSTAIVTTLALAIVTILGLAMQNLSLAVNFETS